MKIKEELLNLQNNLESYPDLQSLEKDMTQVLNKQEKIWRFLFTKKDESKCRTIIKTFFDSMDFIHRDILKSITNNWDSNLMLIANKPLFFVVEILEKYPEEIRNYSNSIRRQLLLFFGRELATFEKSLKDPLAKGENKFDWVINTADHVTSIIKILQRINKIINGKLPHFPEIFSYLQKCLLVSSQMKAEHQKIWDQNKESIYFMLYENIDSLSKIYHADENCDYTVGSLYENLQKLKDSDITSQNSLKLELFDSKIEAMIESKQTKPALFCDNGPLIKVRSLVPRIQGFDDDGLETNDDVENRQKEEKKKLKKKKKIMEKKLVRELAEDTRMVESARMGHQAKIDVQKTKKYNMLKAELEKQQMIMKKEATSNTNVARRKKVKGTRIAGTTN